MKKLVLAGLTACVFAGSSAVAVYAHQRPWFHSRFSMEDRAAFADARIAAVKAGLRLTPEQEKHILGVEACLWTETKPTDAVADEYIWPRLIALAEVGWSPASTRDWAGFKQRLLDAHYERLGIMGLGAADATEGGSAAIRQQLIERTPADVEGLLTLSGLPVASSRIFRDSTSLALLIDVATPTD